MTATPRPYAGASGGSKITYTVGLAVERAAREARRQLLAIAADRLEASVEDLEIVDRAVRVRGVPARVIAVADLAKASMQFGAKYEPVYGHGASATVARSPAFAAHLSEVEVDIETGAVRVTRHLTVQDVGRAINPAAVEGQIQGGVVQGIGWALLERMPYDDRRASSSRPRSWTTRLPQSDQMPPVESVLLEVPIRARPLRRQGRRGASGGRRAGRGARTQLRAATGHRFTSLPITASSVVEALDGRARIADGDLTEASRGATPA